MPSSKELFKLDLKNKLILVRVDLNLPVVNGVVQDETRLQSVLPTIQGCLLYTSPSPRD